MRHIRASALVIATSALLASCSIFSFQSKNTEGIQYNYKVADLSGHIKVTQVYDLNGKTVVQIAGLSVGDLEVCDPKGRVIPFEVIGESAVLDRKYASFTVKTNAGYAQVKSLQTLPVTTTVKQSAAAPIADNPHQAALRDEIASIREQLAMIKKELVVAKAYQSELKAKGSSKITISFENNSSTFSPTPEQSRKLLGLVRDAGEINISGFTDSDIDNQASANLAKLRANSARNYLVKKGVDSKIITTNFQGYGNYVANNKLAEGKAKNRRVEIVAL